MTWGQKSQIHSSIHSQSCLVYYEFGSFQKPFDDWWWIQSLGQLVYCLYQLSWEFRREYRDSVEGLWQPVIFEHGRLRAGSCNSGPFPMPLYRHLSRLSVPHPRWMKQQKRTASRCQQRQDLCCYLVPWTKTGSEKTLPIHQLCPRPVLKATVGLLDEGTYTKICFWPEINWVNIRIKCRKMILIW